MSLDDAGQKIETWLQEYNGERPHGALGAPSPDEFVARSEDVAA